MTGAEGKDHGLVFAQCPTCESGYWIPKDQAFGEATQNSSAVRWILGGNCPLCTDPPLPSGPTVEAHCPKCGRLSNAPMSATLAWAVALSTDIVRTLDRHCEICQKEETK